MFIQLFAQTGHFLRWTIHHQYPVNTGLGGIPGKDCVAVALNRIQVTHQYNGCVRIPGTESVDCIQHTAKRDAPGNRAFTGQLDDRSVCRRIGKRNAEFQ